MSLLYGRQLQVKSRALRLITLRAQPALVYADDGSAYGQPQTQAVFLGGVEWLEYALHFLRKTAAVIPPSGA